MASPFYLTVRQATTQLGVTEDRIDELIDQGILTVRSVREGRILLYADEVRLIGNSIRSGSAITPRSGRGAPH